MNSQGFKLLGALIVLAASGCGGPTVGCSDESTLKVVHQIFEKNVTYRTHYPEKLLDERAQELAQAHVSIEDIVTRRRPTSDSPTAQCEAKIVVEVFEVGRDMDEMRDLAKRRSISHPPNQAGSPRERARSLNASDQGTDADREEARDEWRRANREYAEAQRDARQEYEDESAQIRARLADYEADPTKLIRLGQRKSRTYQINYSAGLTDDGRAIVQMSVD